MGLLDIFKGNKEKPVHTCYRCKKEFSGFLNGSKLSDGEYICFDCNPSQTKLMKKKDVVRSDFRFYELNSKQLDNYIAYRAKDAERAKAFTASEELFNGSLLIDRSHMWFKLKDYEEIFFIQQISSLLCGASGEDGKYTIVCVIMLKDNAIYQAMPELSYTFKAKAFFKKKQIEEIKDEIMALHQQLAPKADLTIM